MLINSRDLHIEIAGPEDGHPIICLHHGLGSTRAWRHQVPAFVGAGFRVLSYDRWGYGRSDARPFLSVPGFEDDLIDLKSILDIYNYQQVTLIGHSDGGSIALYFAAQFPEHVTTLVTVAAHIYLEEMMVPGILGIKRAFENDSRFRGGLRRAHGDKFESTFNNWFDGWKVPDAQEWDMRPEISKIQCPVLVIQGTEDEHASPQHAVDIAENIADSESWLVPGANHMLPQEIPGEFNRKVISFINSNLESEEGGVVDTPLMQL
jgi:pimeloyl-ACP methyl ester carboxylesterase